MKGWWKDLISSKAYNSDVLTLNWFLIPTTPELHIYQEPGSKLTICENTCIVFRETRYLGADNIFVWGDVIQCVVVILLHRAQRLLPASSTVQRSLWWGGKKKGFQVRWMDDQNIHNVWRYNRFSFRCSGTSHVLAVFKYSISKEKENYFRNVSSLRFAVQFCVNRFFSGWITLDQIWTEPRSDCIDTELWLMFDWHRADWFCGT